MKEIREIDRAWSARLLSWAATSAIAFLLSVPGTIPLSAQTPAQTTSLSSVDPVRYLDTIKTLTAPKMEGRGDGTKGLTLAAGVLESRYKELGLEPAGTNGYFQPFDVVTGAKISGINRIQEKIGGAAKDLKLNDDFAPFSFSSSGEADGAVVFAGYGATAPEFGYDDYAGLDVKGKIVLLLRYEPAGFAAKGGHQGLTQHADITTKAINARNRGALAVVIVNGAIKPGESDLLTRFGSVSGPENIGIPLLQVKNNVADAWFAAAGKSMADVQSSIDKSGKPASFDLPATLKLAVHVNVETEHATISNVLAYLPGQTDEYVVVGAHYDHLGYGYHDSLAPSQAGQIHPGADDNASGTSGVLELARLLAPIKGKLRRGILFSSFAGEEIGLLGSAHWVREPTRPLNKAVAMINMDMIGRIQNKKVYVGGVGTGSTFQPILAAAEKDSGFDMQSSPGGYAASDHTSYVAARIPVLFFFSGLHADYHKPSDTWDKINAPDAAKLLGIVEKVVLALGSAPERPAFVTVAASQQEDPHSGLSAGPSSGGGYGPYFGSIPDFGQTEKGVRFSDVQPGSPAAKAGLKGGDVLVHFGDKPIGNLYDFTDALRASKVGDVVEVTVMRDDKPLKVSVKLEQRR